jgi:hypothetical protein
MQYSKKKVLIKKNLHYMSGECNFLLKLYPYPDFFWLTKNL